MIETALDVFRRRRVAPVARPPFSSEIVNFHQIRWVNTPFSLVKECYCHLQTLDLKYPKLWSQ